MSTHRPQSYALLALVTFLVAMLPAQPFLFPSHPNAYAFVSQKTTSSPLHVVKGDPSNTDFFDAELYTDSAWACIQALPKSATKFNSQYVESSMLLDTILNEYYDASDSDSNPARASTNVAETIFEGANIDLLRVRNELRQHLDGLPSVSDTSNKIMSPSLQEVRECEERSDVHFPNFRTQQHSSNPANTATSFARSQVLKASQKYARNNKDDFISTEAFVYGLVKTDDFLKKALSRQSVDPDAVLSSVSEQREINGPVTSKVRDSISGRLLAQLRSLANPSGRRTKSRTTTPWTSTPSTSQRRPARASSIQSSEGTAR